MAALGNPVELNALGVTDNFGYTNLSFEKKPYIPPVKMFVLTSLFQKTTKNLSYKP